MYCTILMRARQRMLKNHSVTDLRYCNRGVWGPLLPESCCVLFSLLQTKILRSLTGPTANCILQVYIIRLIHTIYRFRHDVSVTCIFGDGKIPDECWQHLIQRNLLVSSHYPFPDVFENLWISKIILISDIRLGNQCYTMHLSVTIRTRYE